MTHVLLTKLVPALASGFIYTLFLAGLLILCQSSLRSFYASLDTMRRFAAGRRPAKHSGPSGPILDHLEKLLAATVKYPLSAGWFLTGTVWIFILVFLIGVSSLTIPNSVLVAAFYSAGPYVFLRIKLIIRSRKGSFEGEILVSEFLRHYRAKHYNVYETLEALVKQENGLSVSKHLLFQVLLRLRNTGTSAGVKNAADLFSFGIRTNWGRMLAGNIRLAAERGTNVSLAVEDILIQLRQAKGIYEERKRLNSEAARMALIMVPLLYVVTGVLAIRYLELSPARFLKNQFMTGEGLILLMAIGLLFLFNLAMLSVLNNQKFDY